MREIYRFIVADQESMRARQGESEVAERTGCGREAVPSGAAWLAAADALQRPRRVVRGRASGRSDPDCPVGRESGGIGRLVRGMIEHPAHGLALASGAMVPGLELALKPSMHDDDPQTEAGCRSAADSAWNVAIALPSQKGAPRSRHRVRLSFTLGRPSHYGCHSIWYSILAHTPASCSCGMRHDDTH